MTPIDQLTGHRIDLGRQVTARRAICRAVRQHGLGADEIGPRWRVGSNAPAGTAPFGEIDPCHLCGGDGGALISFGGVEFCPSCKEEWVIGDYDFEQLADVLRYRTDLAAGLVQPA